MIDKEMKELNSIIKKTSSTSDYDELIYHEYIQNIIKSSAYRIFRDSGYTLDIDDIMSKAHIKTIEMFNEFTCDLDDEYLSANFVSFLHQYLYLRLLNDIDEFTSLFDEETCSIEAMGFPNIFTPKNLRYDNFENDVVNKMSLKRVIKDSLSPREYEVVILIFFDGLEAKEVAEQLGVTRSTVYSLKYRALDKIREFMQ